MLNLGKTRPTGTLGVRAIRQPRTSVPAEELSLWQVLYHGFPRLGLSRKVFFWRLWNCRRLIKPCTKIVFARLLGIKMVYGALALVVIHKDNTWQDYGLASLRVVTTAGVNFIVDAFQNIVELEIMKFHGLGTGSTAEAVGDTALVTELTTEYNNAGDFRATGTTIEGASANIYRTVATNVVDAAVNLREHGIFSVITPGAGVLLDRSVFASINLASGDSLQTTYDLTVTAGG